MYEIEIETNNTVKRIEDPRKVKVVDAFFTTFVKVMDGNGKWTIIGHCFNYPYAVYEAIRVKDAINDRESFIEVDLN